MYKYRLHFFLNGGWEYYFCFWKSLKKKNQFQWYRVKYCINFTTEPHPFAVKPPTATRRSCRTEYDFTYCFYFYTLTKSSPYIPTHAWNKYNLLHEMTETLWGLLAHGNTHIRHIRNEFNLKKKTGDLPFCWNAKLVRKAYKLQPQITFS